MKLLQNKKEIKFYSFKYYNISIIIKKFRKIPIKYFKENMHNIPGLILFTDIYI